MTEQNIKRNKMRQYWTLAMGFVGLYFWYPYILHLFELSLGDWGWHNYLQALFAVWMVAIVVGAVRRAMDQSPAIILNKEGLTDRVSQAQLGLVPWEFITSCELTRWQRSEHLVVFIHEFAPKKEHESRFREGLAKIIKEQLGTPLAMPIRAIAMDGQELKAEIDSILEAMARANHQPDTDAAPGNEA